VPTSVWLPKGTSCTCKPHHYPLRAIRASPLRSHGSLAFKVIAVSLRNTRSISCEVDIDLAIKYMAEGSADRYSFQLMGLGICLCSLGLARFLGGSNSSD